MGITNFVSRPFAGLATILCEYTNYPMNYVLVFSLAGLLVVNHIQEIKMDDSFCWTPKKEKEEIEENGIQQFI
jgi:hypothetical protein